MDAAPVISVGYPTDSEVPLKPARESQVRGLKKKKMKRCERGKVF
jgi:hypothetical protein